MKISASDQVTAWPVTLPPHTKRRVRIALRSLTEGKGDIKGLQGPRIKSPHSRNSSQLLRKAHG
jgi:hypothetical protein